MSENELLSTYIKREELGASRMKWWGIYLVREKRRLQGIADAVHVEQAEQEQSGRIMDDSTVEHLTEIDEY